MSPTVEEFVKRYLKLSESQAKAEGECLFVSLRGEPEHVYAITFSREEANRKGCELVAVGSPFFRLIAEDARRRGVAFASIPKVDPKAALEKIQCINCNFELESAEETRQHALKLTYLFTISTTKRRQKMVEVAISDSGKELPWLYSFRGCLRGGEPEGIGEDEIRSLLERSFQILNEKVEKELKEIRDETERYLSEAINRIQSYYAQLRDEAINQAEFARSQAQKGSLDKRRGIFTKMSYEEAEKLIAEYDKLEALDIEKERSRYQVKAEATLVAAILLSFSSFKCRAILRNFNGNASKEIVVRLLPNGDVEEPILCDACKRPIGEIYLCSNGHMVGEECLTKRTSIGEFCTLCDG
jgi:hypothetical protein